MVAPGKTERNGSQVKEEERTGNEVRRVENEKLTHLFVEREHTKVSFHDFEERAGTYSQNP